MKTIAFQVICLLLTASVTLLAQNIELKRYNIPVTIEGETLKYPFAGGADTPQLNPIDLNNDGIDDLLIFDREGNTVSTFINGGTAGEVDYSYAPDYEKIFPNLENWVSVVDYNCDGVPDIFAHARSIARGIDGIVVYRGSRTGDDLSFELVKFPENAFDILFFPLDNGSKTQIYVSNIDYPAIVDVDNDGDIDILTFNPGGGFVEYFKNETIESGFNCDSLLFVKADDCWGKFYESGIGEASAVELSDDSQSCGGGLVSDDVTFRHAGSTMLAFDADGDCDKELVLGDLSFANVNFLTNGGTCENAWMTEQDVTYPDSRPVDIPEFPGMFLLDLNNDGAKDFVAVPNNKNGSVDTDNIWFYPNTQDNENYNFEYETNDVIVKDMIDVGTGAHPAFVDVNADGLLDLVIGNSTIFKSGIDNDPRLFLFLNTGTATEPAFELTDDNYLNFSELGSTTFNLKPAFGDLNGDGDLDLVVGDDRGQLFYFENTAGEGNPLAFANYIYGWMDIDVGQAAAPQIADLNRDGLGDLIIGERGGNNNDDGACGTLNYFENQGSTNAPAFTSDPKVSPNTDCLGKVFTIPEGGLISFSAPAVLDFGDRVQIIVGTNYGEIKRYENVLGNLYSDFSKTEENVGNTRLGIYLSPAFADLNNDGKLEMMVGNRRGGVTLYETNLNLNGSTPIKNVAEEYNFNVFPNPAKAILNLQFDNNDPKTIRLFDATGRLLKVNTLNAELEQLDVSDLASGIYLLQVNSVNKTGVRKIVIE